MRETPSKDDLDMLTPDLGVDKNLDVDKMLSDGKNKIINLLQYFFLFQPVLHDWCNKGRGMCYPVCGMVHIKQSFLLIGKSSLCNSSSLLSRYLSGPLPYV